MKPQITVVIPTYKRPENLKRLLEDLLHQTLPIDQFEIRVVDNNSGDDTETVVSSYIKNHPANIFYHLQEKKGAAATRNLGIAKAQSDIILFLDDDMSVTPKLIEEHILTHKQHSGEAVCVLGYFETAWAKKDDIFLKFLKKSEMQNDFPFEMDDEVSFRYFYTGNISCAREALLKVGGFDEGFTMYGVEDIDLGYRLSAHNTKIYFNKKAESFHNYNPELEDFIKKRRQAGASLGYFLWKYPHLKEYFNFGDFPLLVLGLGRLLSWLILGPYVKLSRSKEVTILHYIYFFFLMRWEIYKSYLAYAWKKKREARRSLSSLLG